MKYYAIRQKSTGFYLPADRYRRRVGGGYTHDEPQPISLCAPRLFRQSGSARRALTWWLKGITSVSIVGRSAYGDERGEDWHTDRKPHRNPKDMEVVKIELKEA